MEKQKICIVGGGLTGLITAIALSKLNLKIDLVTNSTNRNIKTNRTIAISQQNYNFLKELNFSNFSKKDFWPCSGMKLYTESEENSFFEIFELDKHKKQGKEILYMVENSKIINFMMSNIKKNKLISIKTKKKISGIIPSGTLKSLKFHNNEDVAKYNLIIICAGNDSSLIKKIFKNEAFQYSYEETAITSMLKHNSLQNNVARQIFLNNEIIAFLPISKTKTSIVWTVNKNIVNDLKKNDLLLKKKIKFYAKDYLKNVKFATNFEYKDLNFSIRKKYYQDRILLFGEALHVVHPLAGQGFNMTIRDLESLSKTLKSKIELGLDIGTSDILSEFSEKVKPENFIYSFGIDFLKNCFSIKSENIKKLRNNIILELSKNNIAKDIFFNLANKGFKF